MRDFRVFLAADAMDDIILSTVGVEEDTEPIAVRSPVPCPSEGYRSRPATSRVGRVE